MKRMITVASIAAISVAGVWVFQSASAKKPGPQLQAGVLVPAHVMSRREHMARLVAETAAATAEKTAKNVIARKAAPQETAAR